MTRLDLQTTPHAQVLATALEVLKQGGLVVFPTETTYGAGVDATNPEAVAKLLAYKSRREGKPLSIAVNSGEMADQYVMRNDQAKTAYQRYLPGPVTVVSTAKPGLVADGVASEFGTLGVRIPAYPLVLELVEALGKPITATSANGSGEKRPYAIADILPSLSQKQLGLIDLILDAGELPHNPPSTIIDTTTSTPITLRQGEVVVPASAIAQAVITSNSETETADLAGKLLLSHWDAIKTTGLVIALDGPLGAGKTAFTKGVARFLGIDTTITSPTYTYRSDYDFNRHGVTGQLFHFDWWKLESVEQLKLLEFPEICVPNTVTVIEWWSQLAGLLDLGEVATPIVHVSLKDLGGSIRELQLSQPKSSPAAQTESEHD